MFPSRGVLLIIDLQKAIDDPSWGVRNNPQCETNVAKLVERWRDAKRKIVHVRHSSSSPLSTYWPEKPLWEFKPEAMPIDGETVVTKHHHSAFIGTGLQEMLTDEGFDTIVVTGVITNNSVEATVRHANNLGFHVYVVSDATFTFGRMAVDGSHHKAEEVHLHSLSNMNVEYATVVTTADLLA
jgi:nicotinamidase-related amidase